MTDASTADQYATKIADLHEGMTNLLGAMRKELEIQPPKDPLTDIVKDVNPKP